eukprot:s4464_g11.t1
MRQQIFLQLLAYARQKLDWQFVSLAATDLIQIFQMFLCVEGFRWLRLIGHRKVDRTVNAFQYHFGDISEWPNDMVRVHTGGVASVQTCYLGSLAAVRCLADASDVQVAISLCATDMQRIRGQPEEGWEKFLADKGIEHVCIDLDDPTSRNPEEDTFCKEMANVFFTTWLRMCTEITRLLQRRSAGVATGLLFHCFGGINRSSAASVAWLIFNYDMTADAAIAKLLRARPSLKPWHRRPHILWALKSWERRRTELFQTVHEQCPTPVAVADRSDLSN